jgi:uncharacterized membrane-anchored protein
MTKRTSLITFVAAVVIQALILIAVPARKVVTRATGKTVVFKVEPIDPYSVLSGYYTTFSLDISRVDAFPNAQVFPDGAIYAVVARGDDGTWKPALLESHLPANLPENRVAILGQLRGGLITYGIEQFYIPEAQRGAIADDLRKNRDKARIEVKVDRSGHAALERLRIEDRVYE